MDKLISFLASAEFKKALFDLGCVDAAVLSWAPADSELAKIAEQVASVLAGHGITVTPTSVTQTP